MSGPYCTMLLGDMGADVLKVEQPGKGDDTRHWRPPSIGTESAYYLSVNRNKRSVTVNLKTEAGVGIIRRLVQGAEVVVENFSPGTASRLGLGYARLRAVRPDLVYCSISGFGQHGPESQRTAYDLIVQGMSGLMSITGEPDGPPVRLGVPIADLAAGMSAAFAIVAALFHRERTGEGQYIDCSMLGSQLALLTYQAQMYAATWEVPPRTGNAHAIISPYQTFRTRDGHINVAVGNDGLWLRLCRALDLEDTAERAEWLTNAGRIQNAGEVAAAIQSKLDLLTTEEVMTLLDAAGVPCGPIYTVPEAIRQPQAREYGLWSEVTNPTLGLIHQLGFPYSLSASPAEFRLPPPLLGEHTDEVLVEAGYTPAQVTALREQGVV
ncbi:MAG: CoA transferase [Chloroflexota bacterium]|nr:CoA transferase [Chloroflexota bacterium]